MRNRQTFIFLIGCIVLATAAIACFVVRAMRLKHELFVAIEAQDASMVRALVDKGTSVNARKHCVYMPNTLMVNDTPLIAAVRVGNEEIIALLLQAGADINKDDNYTGNTPLLQSMNSRSPNRYKLAGYLIEQGADIHAIRRRSDETPLAGTLVVLPEDSTQTTEEGFALFCYLIENGVHLATVYPGQSILTCAAHYHNYNAVQYLIENKYYAVDDRDERGDTALITAARAGDVKMVELLLSYGADRTLADADGETAYDYAQENQWKEMIDALSS